MKNFTLRLLGVMLLLSAGHHLSAQISGLAFRDFNANGTRETTNPIEPGLGGVTVNIYDSVNVLIATTTTSTVTATLGQYSFPVGTVPVGKSVRIEFSGLVTGDKQGFGTATASGSGSAVQFAKAPSTTSNYGVSYPRWYSSTTDPFLATTRYTSGNASVVSAGGSGTMLNLMIINNSSSGDQTAVTTSALNRYTGAVFGLVYQKETRKLFEAAYLKRFSSYGPSGIGAIYSSTISTAGVPSNPALFVDVSTIGITVGADPHGTMGSTPTSTSNDAGAWPLVGKRGMGNMTLSDDGKYIYVVNMNPTGSPALPTLNRIFIDNPAVVPTSANVTSWAIPTPTLTGATTAFRPMAVKYWKGRIFVGGVCVKEITGNQAVADTAGMKGVVYEFNETAGTFTTVLSFPLTYKRPYIDNNNTQPFRTHYWGPWQNSTVTSEILYDAIGGASTNGFPYGSQPMLADIEFDVNGDMLIGLRDRWGDQIGWANYMPTGSTAYNGISSSEILRAGNCSGTFTMENNAAVCGGTATGGANLPGYASYSVNTTNVGPGGGLYYYNENPPTFNHQFRSNGGLAVLAGSNLLTFTAMDPTNNFNTGGILHAFNSTIGANSAGTMRGGTGGGAQLFTVGTGGPGKASGMGDVEYLTDAQPIQVGNRIWNDANGNGIQDANETTLAVPAGTTVTLRSPGPDNDYATTGDNQSWTTTTNADGTYYFSALSSADTRKNAAWTGVGNVILPNQNYRVEISVPTGFQLTKTDAVSNTMDNLDNDAVLNTAGTIAYIDINTGDVNHSFDIGFKPLATVGDRVWLDNGLGGGTAANGVQDGTEPGVAGVTVTLFNSSGTPIATTVTDSYGNYLFDNLTPADYTIGFTLPPNYTFTTQTNTTDDNNTTGASTTGSDVSVTTGRTYTITLSAGENNRNIDAGLIFTTPLVSQSLGNTVWLDTDKNGVQNGTEPGVSGVTVTLYNNSGVAIAKTITDASGRYLFSNIATGTYTVGFSLPTGMQFTAQGASLTTDLNSDANTTTGRTNNITVNSGDNIVYVDAGIYPIPTTTASLGDRVWNDLNHDGIQDANEKGIGNVTVRLYINGNPTPIATTITDPSGYYMFTNLAPGDYKVEFVKPAGYTFSPQKVVAGTAANNSDPSTTTGITASVNLKAGDRNTSIDAGMYITTPAGTLKLGDKVWNDLNRNGIQDANEPGVPGITVTLYRNGTDGLPGTADDVVIATTFTDANGNYLFTDLAASTGVTTYYNVSFTNLPANYSFTILNQSTGGGTTANDNDANPLGRTTSINLVADDLNVDAGIIQGVPAGKGTLGDRVWYDLNADGVQNTGELGVGGVTVTLQKDTNGDGLFSGAELSFATTTTDALGNYLFGGLDAANYRVVFSNMPVGMIISPRDAAAGTDETDSDGDNAGTTIIAGTTSTTGVYTLATGEDNLTVDLGLRPVASRNTLGDFVWYDINSNGLQDSGEPGVAGVSVTLYNITGVAIAYTTTDANGNYLFANLADGTYSVGFTNFPAGFSLTGKSVTNDLTGSDADLINARTPTVTLTYATGGTSRDNRSLDAGLITTRAALGNYVWLDTNGNGVQDAAEKGISGVTVILYASNGTTVLASTITDANGKYLFPNLTAGSYMVGFLTVPDNLQFTQQNGAGDNGDNTNSDANPLSGKTSVIVLNAGEVDLTIDAGLRPAPTATVGDYVWSDLDSDGLQGANEPGIGGMIATLYDASNNPIGSAITDGDGYYLITNVPPGTGYYIIFSNGPNNPVGSSVQPTFTVQGSAGGTNTSHADATGKTNTFTVNNGDNIRNIDAGIKDYPGRAVLPVQSLELSATLHNTTATVNWVTDNEINTDRFIVERSIDNKNFIAAGEKAAAGNNAGRSYYSYDDNIAAVNANIIYYRIKAVDANGKTTYSKVVAVRISNIGAVRIWPSPFISQVTVSLYSSTAQPVSVQLIDYSGKAVRQQQYNTGRGNNQLTLAGLNTLAAGTYVIRIIGAEGEVIGTQSLLKK